MWDIVPLCTKSKYHYILAGVNVPPRSEDPPRSRLRVSSPGFRVRLLSEMNETLLTICRTDEVPVGGVIKAETNGLVVAVFNLGGRFFVTDDHCTHGPGSLSEGFVDGDEIECDFHNGRFHIPTGAVAGPPCTIPLPTYAVKIIEDQVCIDPTPRIVA